MSNFYDTITTRTKGAWVVHHGQKTTATQNGGAEFPALDAAAKAASLLSQLAASAQIKVEQSRINALARASGLNPRTELPELLKLLERRRLIETSSTGDIEVLGLTSGATVQHAAEIFEEQNPTPEERASIAVAELTSAAPAAHAQLLEFLSDEFKFPSAETRDFLIRSEVVGFVNSEGRGADKLYFNGNLFRRDNLLKVNAVLGSLFPADEVRTAQLDAELAARGCISIEEAERILGTQLFEKLKAAGMYDVNLVINQAGEFGFITRPAAFHKYNDPHVDDAFDLAKALVAALFYGMTQSRAGRGKIQSVAALLRKLIVGHPVGPATAIGEDYRVLETKGVIRVTKAQPYGFWMKLLKLDVGEMALKVLTTGELASMSALDHPLPGKMSGYSGPEKTRSDLRRRQVPASKRGTEDVLQALRTKGAF